MKTFALAAGVGLITFPPSLVPGSTAQTAYAQSKQQQAVANCVKHIGASAKAPLNTRKASLDLPYLMADGAETIDVASAV